MNSPDVDGLFSTVESRRLSPGWPTGWGCSSRLNGIGFGQQVELGIQVGHREILFEELCCVISSAFATRSGAFVLAQTGKLGFGRFHGLFNSPAT